MRRTTTVNGRHCHVSTRGGLTDTADGHFHLVDDPALDDLTADMSWWKRPVPAWLVLAYGPAHAVVFGLIYGWLS